MRKWLVWSMMLGACGSAPVGVVQEASSTCQTDVHIAAACLSGSLCGGPGYYPCPKKVCTGGVCGLTPVAVCSYDTSIDLTDTDERAGTCELKSVTHASNIFAPVIPGPPDLNFLVATDLHVGKLKGTASDDDGPVLMSKIAHHVDAMNQLSRRISPHSDADASQWPPFVRGQGALGDPIAVVATGDMTAHGFKEDVGTFRAFYERELNGSTFSQELLLPLYPGLGNHDVGSTQLAEEYQLDRVLGSPMINYLDYGNPLEMGSYNYSWDWNGVHLVQLNTWAGDTSGGRRSGLLWLVKDLAAHAANGQPVILFQHYAFDSSSFRSDF